MARKCRKLSSTNVYHVVMRGNEKRIIFYDDHDRYTFLNILKEKREKADYSILAYCLMTNHIHLMVDQGCSTIGQVMKLINTTYAQYFNHKYQRTGHLFQDRFKSEPIENDQYLFAAIRYIHNNPVKAGICRSPIDYRWSSYQAIVCLQYDTMVDYNRILEYFGTTPTTAVEAFINFSQNESDLAFIDLPDQPVSDKSILTTQCAVEHIQKFLRLHGYVNLEQLLKNKHLRNELITSLKNNSTLSTRILAELLQVNRNTIQRI